MPIDWDSLVVGPTVTTFGEGGPDVSGRPIYIPVTGAPYALNGVFDHPVGQIEMNDPTSAIQSPKPILGCRLADFAIPPRANDKVYVPRVNATYVVRAVSDDSHGGVLLELLVKTRHSPGYFVPGYLT
jgi:hypothetical protein